MPDTPNNPGPPDLGDAFQQSVGEPYREPDRSVTGTARAEIENREAHAQAQDAHVVKWQEELRRLSYSTEPYPDFDLGSRGHRNLLSEYEERKTNWDRQAAQIDENFEVKKDNIRQNGQTLSDEFNTRSDPGPSPGPTAPVTPPPTQPPSDSASEFAVSEERPRDVSVSIDFAAQAHDQQLVKSR